MKAKPLLFVSGAFVPFPSVPLLRAQTPLANALGAADLVWTWGGARDVG